ncbi:hypothetical protein TNCV_4070151 [Trichonephila clavipes]|nr:hypothetical protein TNCV_4070151 [Trichonephila clavipes]
MWNELVCQFRSVCDNDPTILLTRSPRKGSPQRVVTIRSDHSPHLQGFHGCLKSSFSRMTNLPVRLRASHNLFHPDYILYSRAFGDEPCNFKPRSSGEDDTSVDNPSPNFHTTPMGEHLSLDIYNMRRHPTPWVISVTGLELMTHWTRVRYLDH